ncbi:branched-chain amino acid ABC transporter permease [Cognatishimia sp. 1_MG-2023]|uniref:branched-chain amino acid ABC transporter permease n=1 Tax=Cognatishimia sp. 1_MG-2023 TaxID=3062642 RepID=UPI0026E20386|nr:branched-chain amino acid ABC transporter permease [Cognatishimia sp. 1_MG-2023]MDO6728225.1 branched-chain amino acid ABC transporter permease [Cognatishimia sp. 1_MG-2023]
MSELVAQQVLNALALGGVYALLGLGLAMVFSVLGMINFAHGELMTFTGYALIFLSATLGWPFFLAVFAAFAVAAASAALIERVAFRPVRGASLTTMLLTTFAISSILHVVFQNFISPRPIAVAIPDWLTSTAQFSGLRIGMLQCISLGVTVVALIGLTVFLRFSITGLAMRAAAQDFSITRLMGIPANRVIVTAFAISGLLAGLSGFLWVAQRGSVDPLMGFVPVLKAFIAVVLGGLGSLPGAVLGGFLLGFLEVLLRAMLPSELLPFRDAISLSIIITILVLRPNGLLGRAEAVR